MKKFLFLGFFSVMLFMAANAFALGVLWTDPNSSSMGVTGYYVYWMPQDGSSSDSNRVYVNGYLNTQCTIDNSNYIYGETYTFKVTAVNANGESLPSDPADWTMPWPGGGGPEVPSAPGGIQFSNDLGPPITSIEPTVMP
jgi:hypothetical protein